MNKKKTEVFKKGLFFSFIFILSLVLVKGSQLDDLKKKLDTVPDKDKSQILNEIVEIYHEKRDEEKILFYSQQTLKYARQFNQTKNEIFSLSNIAYAYVGFNNYSKAFEYAQRSVELAEKKGDFLDQINAYKSLVEIYDVQGKFDHSLRIYKKIRNIAKDNANIKEETYGVHLIAIIKYRQGDYSSSLESFKKANSLYKKIGDRKNVIITQKFIGAVYSKLNDDKKAIEHFLETLGLCNQKKYLKEAGRVYYSLGKLFFKQKNYNKAKSYFEKSHAIFKDHKLQPFIANVHVKIGSIYFLEKEYTKAKTEFFKALNIINHFNEIDKRSLPEIYLKLGKIDFELGQYKASEKNILRANNSAKKYTDFETEIDSLIYQSKLFVISKKVNSAIRYLKKALDLATKISNIELIAQIHEDLAKVYESKGVFKFALNSQKLSNLHYKQLFNKNTMRIISELETKYQVEKKDKENEILKKNNEIQRLDIERQKIVRNLAIVILVLILIIIGFLIKKYSFLLAFWKKRSFIGHYKLGEKIGSGGSGIVYKANDIHDKTREVAIKILREESSSDENYKKRFKSEGSIIDRFDHPNIVKVIERGESGNTLFLVMEHLKGKSLDKIIEEESPLEYTRIYTVLSEIVSAVSSIHKKNIIHRDLKPENVIIVENEKGDEQAKLLDFGIAKSKDITSLTKTGSVLGTIHYLAPEQIQMGEITFKSDIYSIGVICYELVTGVKPFYAEEEEYILSKIISDEAPAPKILREDIPQDLNVIILNMMEKNPKLRPEIGDIFKYFSSKLEGENKRE